MNALQIEHFSKSYGTTLAVNDISFAIKKGDFFGFLGPNGAGKTSTIKCITGISRFNEGNINVFGTNVQKNYKDARKQIGLSPQEYNVDIFASAEKILWFMGGFYGMKKPLRTQRMEELINRFELTNHKDKPFQALSGGQKRRVMLARAMMHDPDLLILDEPTAGLDVELRRELWQYLKEINEAGKTILLTSHYLEEIELLCKTIAIINNGKIIALKKKEEYIKGGKKLEETYLEITKNSNA